MTQSKQPTSGVDEKAAQAIYEKLPYGIVCIRQVLEAYEAAKAEQPKNALGFTIRKKLSDFRSREHSSEEEQVGGASFIGSGGSIPPASAIEQPVQFPPEFESGHDESDPMWVLCDRLAFVNHNSLGTPGEKLAAAKEAYHALQYLRSRKWESKGFTEEENRLAVQVIASRTWVGGYPMSSTIADAEKALADLLERFTLARKV